MTLQTLQNRCGAVVSAILCLFILLLLLFYAIDIEVALGIRYASPKGDTGPFVTPKDPSPTATIATNSSISLSI